MLLRSLVLQELIGQQEHMASAMTVAAVLPQYLTGQKHRRGFELVRGHFCLSPSGKGREGISYFIDRAGNEKGMWQGMKREGGWIHWDTCKTSL